ncbi:MAG: hypothetical protein Q9204_001299 [Flavoplaca sp. TL-2023a]
MRWNKTYSTVHGGIPIDRDRTAKDERCQNLLDHPRRDYKDQGVGGVAEDPCGEKMNVEKKDRDLCHRLSYGPADDDGIHGL